MIIIKYYQFSKLFNNFESWPKPWYIKKSPTAGMSVRKGEMPWPESSVTYNHTQ